jgi:PHP family Zn ribbon phosphoesterase
MTPANIVNMAKLLELDVIAVTDHNSCRNLPAIHSYAKKNNIILIFGLELCTIEEIHVLCYFRMLDDAMSFDSYVYEKLIKIPNRDDIFGKQEIYNDEDIKVDEEANLLINATDISFNNLDELMSRYKGIYVPAHVNKASNSLLSNLGFVPPESKFKCVEINDLQGTEKLNNMHPYFTRCKKITNSDAHSLGHINDSIHFLEVTERSSEAVMDALIH